METLLVLLIVGSAGWAVWRYTRQSLSGQVNPCDACSNCLSGPGNCPRLQENHAPCERNEADTCHVE